MTNIKVIQKSSVNPGKNILILAGVHGNEKVGVEALEELLSDIDLKSGELTVVFANLKAMGQNKRFIDFNLNRCFLKDQSQEIADSVEGKTAREIMPLLDNADYMLDLHASNSSDSIPFAICGEQSLDFTEKMPIKIITFNWDDFEPGSTDYYMNLQNKVGICVEGGYLGSPNSRDNLKKIARSFLVLTGAIDGEEEKTPDKRVLKIVGLYKNKRGSFKKTRDFADFEALTKKTLVGVDGEKEVYAKEGQILLFVRDREELEEECFLIAEENLLNKKELSNSEDTEK